MNGAEDSTFVLYVVLKNAGADVSLLKPKFYIIDRRLMLDEYTTLKRY